MGAKAYKAAGESAVFTVKVKSVKPNSTYTLEIVKAADGKPSTIKTLTGTWKDAKETKDGVPIEIQGPTATVTWKADGPAAEAKARGHRVWVQIKVEDDKGKKREEKSQELEVYNDWVELNAVDEEGKAIENAGFRVLVDKRPLPDDGGKGRTAADGKKKVQKVPPGKITVEWEKPFKQGKLLEETSTTLKAQLVPAKKAKLLSHKGTSQAKPARQWVNLAADPKAPLLGPKATIKLKLEDGKAGDKIFVRQFFGQGNSKRTGQTLGLVGAQVKPWASKGGLEVTVDAKGEASVEVDMGVAGGDVVQIEAGGTDRCKDIPPVFLQAWRKMYYQLTLAAGVQPPDAAVAAVNKGLEDACIHYEELKDDRATIKESDVPGAWFDSELFGAPAGQKYLVIGAHNVDQFHPKFLKTTPKKAGPRVHVIMTHVLMDHHDMEKHTVEVGRENRVVLPAGHFYMARVPLQQKAFRYSLKTSNEALRESSKWKEVGGENEGQLTWQDIYMLDEPDAKLIVKVPEAAKAHVEGGGKVKFTVNFVTHQPTYNGIAGDGGKLQLISTHSGEKGAPTPPKTISILLLHELGHCLKQAARSDAVPPGLNEADHGFNYEYDGWHCATGLSSEKFKELKTGDNSGLRNQAGCTCVMYGQILDPLRPTLSTAFCSKCLPFLRAQQVELP